jgi:hypothetical protein
MAKPSGPSSKDYPGGSVYKIFYITLEKLALIRRDAKGKVLLMVGVTKLIDA